MTTAREPAVAGYNIARDPLLIKNRIFIGNLPICTREELESICHPYGKVLGALVQKNYGFVQFESEEVANKCAAALNKSTFKSNFLTVRNASIRGKVLAANTKKANALKANVAAKAMPNVAAAAVVPINDCEIIVVNRENTKYAEFVEERLRQAGMRVDVLYPNEDVLLGKVLANISSRGCLYAVLVTPKHEELNSITVNILYGVPAEHRNMPVEDAISLISNDFIKHRQREAIMQQHTVVSPDTSLSMQHDQLPAHPEQQQLLLNMLADNRPLTALQYDAIIQYLQSRREQQVKIELGEEKAPDPEIELQKKIRNIMNKPSVTEIKYELMYPSFEAVKEDKRLMELLHDSRVLSALATLYNSELLKTISDYL